MNTIRWWLVALAAAGCNGESEPVLTACEGEGDPEVAIGDGGIDEFSPWEEGHLVPITQSGSWGFRIEAQTRGLDTREPISMVVRFLLDGETETQDAGANVTFQCEGERPGWAGLFVPLDDADQTEAAAAALSGVVFNLSVSVVDAAEDAATDDGDFEFEF